MVGCFVTEDNGLAMAMISCLIDGCSSEAARWYQQDSGEETLFSIVIMVQADSNPNLLCSHCQIKLLI